MIIKSIAITNFKSFKNLNVMCNNLNILIGANASGKSNFLKIFEFLSNIANHGLDNAISIEGGVEYIRNLNLGSIQEMSAKIIYDPDLYNIKKINQKSELGIRLNEAIYEFSIKFHKKGNGYNISKDKFTLHYEFANLEITENSLKEVEPIGNGIAVFSVAKGRISLAIDFPDDPNIIVEEINPAFSFRVFDDFQIPARTLFLETPFYEVANYFKAPLRDIPIYDFDPKLPKKSVAITGKKELAENGNNLSVVLRDILGEKEKRRKFLNLLHDLLPFVHDIKVQRFADKSLLFSLREDSESKSPYLPASFISDGTISMTALIVALYFQRYSLIVIEEPERNIHPHLIPKIVDMINDVSKEKQIFVTTHNPEIVKFANLENLLFVSRNQEGFSEITKPADNSEVNFFLENEIGIDELFTQNLLGRSDAQ